MTIPELEAIIADLKSQNQPFHNPVMEIQKKFSIPAACFVFALLGVGLGVSNRKDGRLASFVLGIAVIFIYYVVMFTAEAMTKGGLIPAKLSMWVPNIVLGVAGVALLIAKSRGIDRVMRLRLPSLPFRSQASGVDITAADATSSRKPGGPVLVI